MASWSRKLFLLVSLLAIYLVGCGDITSEVASITINPSSATVGVNKPYFFTAIGKDSLGKIVEVSPTWSVEGNIGTIESTGLFTAGSVEGSGYVVAISGSFSGNSSVSITTKGWLGGIIRTPEGGFAEGIIVYLAQLPAFLDDVNSKGQYLIEAIPAGTYEARTRATTIYQVSSYEVTIGSGETVTWSTTLVTIPGTPTIPTTTFPAF
jgi:hypothetical protein